ncbi:MAG: polysaccharide deacetylase family protein [Deltaproteobacteria bacterium]|nr:polysaccharide deacetylase family protein [Deltaproteobacteria bacterium]
MIARPWGGLVLCYHLVDAGVGGRIDLDRATFERHLDVLARHDVRSLDDVVDGSRGIALTFDDAFANFHEVVWPLLRSRGLAVAATLFVPTGFIDGTHASPLSTAPQLRPCSWPQLREMAAQGLSLGSHTAGHRNLRTLDDAAVDADLLRARVRIVEATGHEPRAFCYPQAKWSARTERVARRHHDVIVTGGGTRVNVARRWRVPRVSIVRGGMPLELLLRLPVNPREWFADRVRQWRR